MGRTGWLAIGRGQVHCSQDVVNERPNLSGIHDGRARSGRWRRGTQVSHYPHRPLVNHAPAASDLGQADVVLISHDAIPNPAMCAVVVHDAKFEGVLSLCELHFWLLPWADAVVTNADDCSSASGDNVLQSVLPRLSRREFPFIEPGTQATFILKCIGQPSDDFFVFAVVLKKISNSAMFLLTLAGCHSKSVLYHRLAAAGNTCPENGCADGACPGNWCLAYQGCFFIASKQARWPVIVCASEKLGRNCDRNHVELLYIDFCSLCNCTTGLNTTFPLSCFTNQAIRPKLPHFGIRSRSTDVFDAYTPFVHSIHTLPSGLSCNACTGHLAEVGGTGRYTRTPLDSLRMSGTLLTMAARLRRRR